ncbi:TetR/AcrR family transcriptional regulator [Amycolatopsis sp. 195334CR]|uniref:TetR/AcrR family transcriptional regulator n=1 Tax=Amycolatopsis sp. 195334CR TaxID=2814588 RepID=UPI001A906A89|nr:TetR/AcrR family transcriptional regulator C-terminal domain-containing protein [Amycolatopsis sp. 195334CR]MBN6038118.1 TetR/AcrR family transcriptional regulator C-terminal domain-containing protein [Amycolatopsis sp. 195334CR]
MTDRRPWGSLERAQIIGAALDLARREGLAALTIRRLATEVGASRMALYRHVPDKEALLDLVANEIAEKHVIPEEALRGPWEERLRLLAHGMRRELRAYPGFAERIMTRGNAGPGGLRVAETIASVLTAAGLSEASAARFYLITIDLVLGRAHREANGDPTTPHRNAEVFAAAESGDRAPRLKALLPHLREVTSDQVFDAELDLLIGAIRRETN